MKDNSPIFIVGCGRSGTTLLRLMLNNHSRIAIPEETWYFPDLEKEKDILIGDGSGDWRERIADRVLDICKVHFPHLNKDELNNILKDLSLSDWPKIVSVVNLAFACSQNKPRWGDKTPGYVIHLPVIKKLFPDAKILHIIRDGRDVVPSLLKHWTVGPQTNDFLETVYYWKNHVKRGRVDGPYYFGKDYMELKYEQLVSNPEKVLRSICDFIGEEFEENMLKTNANAGSFVPQWEWHKNTNKPINKERVELWRQKMSRYELCLFHLEAGGILKQLDYETEIVFNINAFFHFLIRRLNNTIKKYIHSLKIFIYSIKNRT